MDNEQEKITEKLMNRNVITLPEGWFVDMNHIFSENNPCLYIADTRSGCSIRIERTAEGVEVQGYLVPVTSPQFTSTIVDKVTKQ